MAISEPEWARAVALLSGARQVALACHVDPDGDALGSMLALKAHLDAQGVETVASFSRSAGEGGDGLTIPAQYHFLPGIRSLVPPERFPPAPAVLVTLDSGSPDRLGELASAMDGAGTVLVVDHHATGESYGDIRLVDGQAAATAVVVEELIRRLGGTVDRDTAACLYTGLVTDTGRFQYAATTPEVHHLAARLLATGIDHAAIARGIWETHRFAYLKLLGRALDRAQLDADTGLAWTAVRQADLDELSLTMEEAEGVIDVLRSSDTAECTLVLKEQRTGEWKASLRSQGAVDVGTVASALGGGGHRAAAGFTAAGVVEDVVARVRAALRDGQPAREAAG